MKKNVLVLIVIIFSILSLTECEDKTDATIFKNNYEYLNGKENANGKEYRSVSIPKKNPIVITDAKTIISKMENNESFYVYFGSTLCPWCRSVIEKAIEIANDNNIDKIYYVDIWDEEGKEILRDKYVLNDKNELTKTDEGTEEYFKLLELFDNILPDYKYAANKNGGAELDVNEKRIYIPLFISVSAGKVINSITGISELQTNSREELTEEMLKDEETAFNHFFTNTCDEHC